MQGFISAVVRLTVMAAILLIAIAVALGRRQRAVVDDHRAELPRHQPVSGYLFRDRQAGFRMLDVETGALERVRLEGRDRVEHPAISPWRDGLGRSHLAGLWIRLQGGSGETVVGLARLALPGREVLDRVETERVPASPPCWLPDRTSTIVYGGRDGILYRFSFDPPRDDPRPLVWHVQPPDGLLMISDPMLPTDARLSQTIVASLTLVPGHEAGTAARRRARRTQLWWLQLDSEGSAIEAAGPLIAPAPGDPGSSGVDDELPAISTAADGSLRLAYLASRNADITRRLRLAPVSLDRGGRCRVDGADVVELPGDRIRARPAFSRDGRWVHAIRKHDAEVDRADRVSVAEALSGSRARMLYSELRMFPHLVPPRS